MKRVTENELRELSVPVCTPHQMRDISFRELLLLYTQARPGKSHKSRPYRLKKWLAAFGALSAWDINLQQHLKRRPKLGFLSQKVGTLRREGQGDAQEQPIDVKGLPLSPAGGLKH